VGFFHKIPVIFHGDLQRDSRLLPREVQVALTITVVTTDLYIDHVITDVTYTRAASYANIPTSLNTDVKAQDLAQAVDSCGVNAGSLT
jgi:hypothetical protein